jgi:hypothetical protein
MRWDKLHADTRLTVKALILKKLRRRDYWCGKHTSIDNLKKSLKIHLRGDVPGIADELIKEGLLLHHPTSYGTQVSLNPQMKAEIDRFIKEVLGDEQEV